MTMVCVQVFGNDGGYCLLGSRIEQAPTDRVLIRPKPVRKHAIDDDPSVILALEVIEVVARNDGYTLR